MIKIAQGKIISGWLVVVLIFTVVNSWAHEKTWPGRQLKQTYPQATRFTSQQATLNSGQIERIEQALNARLTPDDRRLTFYPAYKGDQKIGMVIFVDETGENGLIEIGVAINQDGKITAVKILDHRESGAIKKEEFLRQFVNKSIQDIPQMEEQISLQPNAVEASRAVIRGVKKALLLKQEVFEH